MLCFYEENNEKYLLFFCETNNKPYICTVKQIIKVMQSINETIANAIVENIEGGNGTFSVEVEIDNTLVEVSGSFEIDVYCEDDYFNGTGAWVTTYVSVIVEDCTVYTYDEDGEEVENDITPDLSEIERYAEMEIAA